MAKLTLNDISNLTGNPLTAETALNQNFTAIEEAIENTLSRDGTTPNYLEASLDANSQRIVNLPYALSGSEPVTLAQVYALVTGEDWTGGVGIPSVVFYQPNQPTGTTAGQVWVNSNDLAIWIFNGTDWIRQEDPNLQLAINIANGASASVGALEPRVLAVEQDSANYNLAIIELESDVANLAGSIVTITSDVGDNTAAIQQEAITRASQDAALASAINSIQAFTNKIYVQASAPADSPPGTLDEGDFWYDSDDGNHPYRWVSGAWVSVQDTSYTAPLYAAIEQEETARVDGDTVLAQSLLSLQAQRDSDYSLIVNNQLAQVAGDEALASDITSLNVSMSGLTTQVGELDANLTSESVARINGDSAVSSQVSSLSTTVNGHTATIEQHTASINGIEGKWTVKVDLNGYITGFGLISSANTATPSSTFTVLANNFRIVTPGLTPITPFQVIGNTTYIKDVVIDSAAIGQLTIGTGQLAYGAVTSPNTAYGDFGGAYISLPNSAVWYNITAVGSGQTAYIYVPNLVPSVSWINLRYSWIAYRYGGTNQAFYLRCVRDDGVVVPGPQPMFTLTNTSQSFAWDFTDHNPSSTAHFYYLQAKPITTSSSSTFGTWGAWTINTANHKR